MLKTARRSRMLEFKLSLVSLGFPFYKRSLPDAA